METLYACTSNYINMQHNFTMTVLHLQFLDGISTTSEVYFYSVPDLESLVQGREVGGVCNSELVRRSTSDPKFVGNFTLTFSLPGTLVCLIQKNLLYTISVYLAPFSIGIDRNTEV